MNQTNLNPKIRRAVAMVLYAVNIPISGACGIWLGHLMTPSLFAITVAVTAALVVDFAIDLVAEFVLPPWQARSR